MRVESLNIAPMEHEEMIKEGLASIIIPRLDYYRRPDGVVEPAWMPVFYNPEAIVSRDFTTMLLRSLFQGRGFYFVDALSGTGIRGIRIALESNGVGLLNDVDPRAYYYMRKNIELNDLSERLLVYHQEANTLLNNLAQSGVIFDYVDIDPYGSPVPYVDSSLKVLGRTGYMGFTATDTGPLTCTYRHKALTRYWSNCIKVDFEKEFAARLLVSNIVKRASALEYEAKPILTLVHRHYIRVFFELNESSIRASRLLDECIGYIWYCEKTLERGFVKSIDEIRELKCSDDTHPVVMGKTWICGLFNGSVVQSLGECMSKASWIGKTTLKLRDLIVSEHDINNPYYRLDRLCAVFKKNMPSMERLLSELRDRGIKCSRTHMDPRGIRLAGSYQDLVDVIKDM